MSRWTGGRKRGVLAVASIAVAVVVLGGVATAVALTHKSQNHARAGLSGSSSRLVSVGSPVKAVADVTPPVAASTCMTPNAFAYSGTLSATAPATVKYRWVYSSGKPGPVRTVRFASAGHTVVAGATVTSKLAGGGWGEIKMISPVAQNSNRAAYKLLCGGSSVAGITATAAVQPETRTVNCATWSPGFTATGSIKDAKAQSVTYHWAQSDGANSAPATLTFTKPGTETVEPLTMNPPAASGSGAAVLVVTSPVTVASSPATYTLTCTTSTTSPAEPAAAVAPAGNPPPPPPLPTSVVVSVNASTTAMLGQPYSGTLTATGGDPPYTWSAVSGLPPGLTATANGATLTVSGTPGGLGTWVASGNVSDSFTTPQTMGWEIAFTVILPPITITANAPSDATVGQPYLGTLTATGGDGTPFTWSVNGLPQGLTGTADGATFTISGTPTGSDVISTTSPPSPGNFTVDVTVSDSETSFGRLIYLVVSPAS